MSEKFNSPESQAEKITLKLDLENPEALIDAIAKIEGERWAQSELKDLEKAKQEDPGQYDVSVAAAVKALERIRIKLEELRKQKSEEANPELTKKIESEISEYESGSEPVSVVYGAGGMNRYLIKSNGEVFISSMHMPGGEEDKSRISAVAEDLGIKVV